MDTRINKFADILVNYSTRVEPGELILINGMTEAEPLIKAVYKKVLQAGGFPRVNVGFPDMQDYFYKFASDDYLNYTCPIQKHIYETYDALINIGGGDNTKALTEVPAEKIQKAAKARHPLVKIVMDRSADWAGDPNKKKGQIRWVVTKYPTRPGAMDAEMSELDYADFVFGAVGALEEDPVAFWQSFSNMQEKYCEWLNEKESIHLLGPNVDLSFNVSGRLWLNCDGRLNMPDGEIFTGPIEDSGNGWVNFTYPAIYNSQEADGVRLELKDGKIIKATAKKGEQFLNDTLDTDEWSRFIGELAIGTNPFIHKFTKSILFDEKIAKSFHMAAGSGYPETGSKLEDAAIHWDMICDMSDGEIYADENLFYKNGEFLI
jgi:aminopeptidase